jgi:hypothetical protein
MSYPTSTNNWPRGAFEVPRSFDSTAATTTSSPRGSYPPWRVEAEGFPCWPFLPQEIQNIVIKLYLLDVLARVMGYMHPWALRSTAMANFRSPHTSADVWTFDEDLTRSMIRTGLHDFMLAFVSKNMMSQVASAARGLIGEWKQAGFKIYAEEEFAIKKHLQRRMLITVWRTDSWIARRLRALARWAESRLVEMEARAATINLGR